MSAALAVTQVRLQREAPVIAIAVAACALAGYLQRWIDPQAQLAGALIFGGFVAIASALLQNVFVLRDLQLSEWSAPFYARQLARATAAVPCIIASAACAAYWGALAVFTLPAAGSVVLSLAAVNAAAVLTMRAGLPGASRWFAPALACATLAAAFFGAALPLPATASVEIAIGFFGVRAYGEALSRYGLPIRFAPEPTRVSPQSRD